MVGGTTDSNPVSFVQAYVDGKAAVTQTGKSLNAQIPMSAGMHRLTVQAQDSTGAIFKRTINITVGTGSPNTNPNPNTDPNPDSNPDSNPNTDIDSNADSAPNTDTDPSTYADTSTYATCVYAWKRVSVRDHLLAGKQRGGQFARARGGGHPGLSCGLVRANLCGWKRSANKNWRRSGCHGGYGQWNAQVDGPSQRQRGSYFQADDLYRRCIDHR